MPALAASADGAYIFAALENDAGQPVIVRATRPDEAGDPITFAEAYAPAAGTAGNVASVPGNADRMYFYGNFGSGVQVIKHTISGPTNTNISPSGLTTKVVNALAVDPGDPDHIIITVNTDQDLLETRDGGTNWSTLNAALGFNATALVVNWQSFPEYDIVFTAGQVTAVSRLLYSPNSGATMSNITGTALDDTTNVVSLELGY